MSIRSPDADEVQSSRSHRALRAVVAHIRPGSFPALFAATLVLYVLNGLAIETTIGTVFVQVGHVAVVCASIYVLSASRLTVWVGLLLLAASLVFAVRLWTPAPSIGRVLQDSIASGFLLWVLGVVLREVFRPSTSERDAVIGALCGFVLILTVFMRLHGLLEALVPGSYRVDGPALSGRSDAQLVAVFQYFSTITLTTVGFGDIVPVTPGARLVTGLEAGVGQIYLAVVIATLVGRVAARRE
jgi:voltage-gated potassium channel